MKISNVLQETSNFKIIELNGGSYPTWEQIVLLPKAENIGVIFYIAIIQHHFYEYSINYNTT
jgi:hypothetical protein